MSFGKPVLASTTQSPHLDDVPKLEKLPTDVFIEKFIEGDDEDFASLPVNGDSHEEETEEREEDLETELGESPDVDDGYESRSEAAYLRACKRLGAPPCSSVVRNLEEMTSVNLAYYSLGTKECKALIYPLVMNNRLTTLNLQGNNLDIESLQLLARLVCESQTITDLNLAENNLRTKGAAVVASVLRSCPRLHSLNLSGNSLFDNEAALIAREVEKHPALMTLDLSHNNFGELGAHRLQHMIAENGILKSLNLSWNKFTGKAVLYLVQGVKENVGLKELDLSWNGFGDDATITLAKALTSSTLVVLNLTATRIGAEGFIAFMKALNDTDLLKELVLSKNPIPEEAAIIGLEYILTKVDELHLEKLMLVEIIYGEMFRKKVSEVNEKFPNFLLSHGYSDHYGKRRMKQYNVVEDAMVEISKYCKKNNTKMVDLFARFDADGSMSVSHEEFKIGLREAKVPVTDEMINALIRELDQDGDGEIDFSELVLGLAKRSDL